MELSDGSTPQPTLASLVGVPVAIGAVGGGWVVVEISFVASSRSDNFFGAGSISPRDMDCRVVRAGGFGAGRGSSKRKLVTKRIKKPLILVTFVRHRGELWALQGSFLLPDVARIIEESQGLRKGKSTSERWQIPGFWQTGRTSEAKNKLFPIEQKVAEGPIRFAGIRELSRADEFDSLLHLNGRGSSKRYLL